jgi:mevalonate pyrophosphate decarboxylase
VGRGIADEGTVVLRAEYKEYHQVNEDVWFPGRVEYYRDDTLWVVSMVRSVTLNETLADTLFTADAGSPVTNFLNIKE